MARVSYKPCINSKNTPVRACSHKGVFFTIYMRRQPRQNEAEGIVKHARRGEEGASRGRTREDNMKKIAQIHSDFKEKFGIPRQSGLVEELEAIIIFEPEYRNPDALRRIEEYSHLWLLWLFSENIRDEWSPTVRPPKLGGNERVGVFATRSPFRPNPIGLSVVRLLGVEETKNCGKILHVSGADLMDGTPIYDIKPYLPYVDAIPDALGGFAEEHKTEQLHVSCPKELLQKIPLKKRTALLHVLAQDPRPAYQTDPDRRYGMKFAGWNVSFCVRGDTLYVKEVDKEENDI